MVARNSPTTKLPLWSQYPCGIFDGEEIYLPESIYQILRQVTPLLAQGKGVTLVPQDHYLTTQEAANLLNISRPYLYTLLDKEEIPYTLIGTHRRIKVEDLLDYKTRRDSDRRKALNGLIEASQELGFYEAEKTDDREKA
ncbi:MAG: helix-turn-helix domain-containing protein [Xenococcaceae cyanobacterium]